MDFAGGVARAFTAALEDRSSMQSLSITRTTTEEEDDRLLLSGAVRALSCDVPVITVPAFFRFPLLARRVFRADGSRQSVALLPETALRESRTTRRRVNSL